MSNDPYAAAADFNESFETDPPKTSTLAIVAFVLSLMLIIGCFIPFVPAVVVVISVVALGIIIKSQGRLKGTVFATIAIVISILASGAQLAMYYGGYRYVQSLGNSTQVIEFAQAGDYGAARLKFSSAALSELTDEKLNQFATSVQTNIGTFEGTPTGLLAYWNDNKSIKNILSSSQQDTIYDHIFENVFSGTPINLVPAQFDNGTAVVILIGAPGSNVFNQILTDIIVIDADGDVVTLLDSELSRALRNDGSTSPPAVEQTEPSPGLEEPLENSPAGTTEGGG